MKTTLGWIPFALALAFEVCLLMGMVRLAWFPAKDFNGWLAFFGFGFPMFVMGATAANLWAGDPRLLRLFGWTSTAFAVLWSLLLLYLVIDWVGLFGASVRQIDIFEWFPIFFGFALPMVLTGVIGIYYLTEQDRRLEEAFDSADDRPHLTEALQSVKDRLRNES